MRRFTPRLRLGSFGTALLTSMLAIARGASAQSPADGEAIAPPDAPPTVRARDLFNDGTRSAHLGDWSQALVAFERSKALRPHAVTTYNIAYCERALGRYTRARKMFDEALAESTENGGTELPDDLAAAARAYLAELAGQFARAQVSLSPEIASVLVDGRPLELEESTGPAKVLWAGTRDPGPGESAPASTFELRLDPGSHLFVVSNPGYTESVTTRSFEPGSETNLVFRLQPTAPPLPSVPPRANATEQSELPHSRVPLYVALAVGGAGLATGVTAGVIAMTQKAKLDACNPVSCNEATYSADYAHAGTAADISTTGFILAGTGAAVGAVLWWLSRGRPQAPVAEPARTPPASGAAAGGALRDLRIAPWVSPTGAGLLGAY